MIYILFLAGGYYGYQNYFAATEDNLSINDKILKNGSVPAEEIKLKAKSMVKFICSDEEILNSWGSSVSECSQRYSKNEAICDTRIFPKNEQQISDSSVVKKLFSQYRKCVLSY